MVETSREGSLVGQVFLGDEAEMGKKHRNLGVEVRVPFVEEVKKQDKGPVEGVWEKGAVEAYL